MSSGGAAAIAVAIAEAVKASGAIVRLSPDDFRAIVDRASKPLVVLSESWFFGHAYHYLTGYKGFVFYAKSPEPLMLKSDIELVRAKRIWIPS